MEKLLINKSQNKHRREGYFKIGDRVRFRQYQAWLEIDGKEYLGTMWKFPMPGKKQEYGFVVDMDGPDIIYVRPRWKNKNFVMEFYSVELELS